MEAQLIAVLQLPADMIMSLHRGGMGKKADIPSHSQMDDEQCFIVEGDKQVLGPSADRFNPLAAQHFLHGGKGCQVA